LENVIIHMSFLFFIHVEDSDGTYEIPKLLLATEHKIVSQGKDFLAVSDES
jgi:hypothetical protein